MKILINENQFKKIINLITEDGDKINVMFVGDSLSAGPGVTWNYQLAKEHPEWDVTHITKGGMRTSWMLQNMLSALSKKKYDKVFIYGGTNDAFWVSTNLSEAVSNIQKMVDATNEQGGQAYVFLGYDAASVMVDGALKPTKYCNPECMGKGRNRFIDLQKSLSSEIKNAIIIPTIQGSGNWAGDGIHIGPSQHKILKDHVAKYIVDNKKTSQGEKPKSNDEEKTQSLQFFENYFNFLNKKIDVDSSSKKNDIKRMQIILAMALKKEFKNLKLGELDAETKKDIIDFQNKKGLKETGYFDVNTQQELTKEIFPSYTPKEKTDTDEKKSVDNFNVITNSGVKVRSIPSNLEQQFKNIPGVDYEKFKSDIESAGIPVKYAIRQLFVESAFSPDVIGCKRVSSAGAKGIAQFMPGTWPAYGKGGDPCKVSDALPAYVKLMSELAKRFKGRLDLAFAGYNSGPNLKIYKKALDEKIPFTELKGKIPNEAYGYASSILQP